VFVTVLGPYAQLVNQDIDDNSMSIKNLTKETSIELLMVLYLNTEGFKPLDYDIDENEKEVRGKPPDGMTTRSID
jgi:hypothetical protein